MTRLTMPAICACGFSTMDAGNAIWHAEKAGQWDCPRCETCNCGSMLYCSECQRQRPEGALLNAR